MKKIAACQKFMTKNHKWQVNVLSGRCFVQLFDLSKIKIHYNIIEVQETVMVVIKVIKLKNVTISSKNFLSQLVVGI